MRAHGVAIPDPTVAPRAFKNAFETQTSAFRSAYTVCGHLLPAGHANQSPGEHPGRRPPRCWRSLAACAATASRASPTPAAAAS